MTISDGTTTLTFNFSDDRGPETRVVQTIRESANGSLKFKTAGERIIFDDRPLVTGAELRSLLDLIHNGASEYFYTPDTIPPEYSSSIFPLTCFVRYRGKRESIWRDNARQYFVRLEIQSKDLFNA